jgi:hypothetical protein
MERQHLPRSRRLGLTAGATLLLALALAGATAAQQGAVDGQVTDKDGQPFPFVTVFLEGEGRPFAQDQLTDENGRFRFQPVPAGSYKLYAFESGFASDKLSNILVEPGGRPRYTIRLLPADQAEEVIQVDTRLLDIVNVKKTEVSATLDGDFVSRIPLQNRRIQDIVALFPGVVRSGSSDSTDISIGGGNSSQIGYRLNGASINDPLDGGASLDIPTAAIDSFKLITTGYSAKYGEQSTGMAEIVTKGGSDVLEFSYGITFRDSDWGAQAVPGIEDAQVFVDELLRAEGTLLESTLRNGFLLLGVDPVSTLEDDSNPPSRHRVRQTISAGGPIVPDKLFFHSTLEAVADDFGNPYAAGSIQNDQILYTGKVNWNVSQENKLALSYSLDVSDSTGFVGVRSTRGTDAETKGGTWTISALDTHIFNNSTFLESQLSFTQKYEVVRPEDTRAGVGVLYQIPLPPGGPTSYITGNAGFDFDETTKVLRLDETLNRTLKGGRHQLEIGGTIQTLNFRSYNASGPNVTDLRVVDDTTALGQTVFPIPPAGRILDFGEPVSQDEGTYSLAAFVHDKWQVTPNLTLDLGLRADHQEFVGRTFIAPRIGFSLDPIGDGKTRFFGNWGIYFDNIFANALQWTANPEQIFTDIYFARAFEDRDFDETAIDEIYKEALATGFLEPVTSDAVAYQDRRYRDRFVLADSLTAPTNKQWAIGLERRLPANMRLQVLYTENRRSHQITQSVETRRARTRISEFELRDRIFNTTGFGKFQQWSVEVQKPFSDRWRMQLSYVWSHNTGPIAPPANPIDPTDVVTQNGTLGNDRTHVVKLQGLASLPWKMQLSADFNWQTGTPLTASVFTRNGRRLEPLGRNTLRLPSSRQLNFGLSRPFQTADGKLNMSASLQVFNLLNAFNVFGGFGLFEVPDGIADPLRVPPLRPEVVPTSIDVGRSLEVGFTVSF